MKKSFLQLFILITSLALCMGAACASEDISTPTAVEEGQMEVENNEVLSSREGNALEKSSSSSEVNFKSSNDSQDLKLNASQNNPALTAKEEGNFTEMQKLNDAGNGDRLVLNEGYAFNQGFNPNGQTPLCETDNEILSSSVTETEVLAGNRDYYFDASVENDNGDGSADNPYKYLTASRISDNSNIHLANGEYDLDRFVVSYGSINIIGENTNQTIIRFNGLGFYVLNSLTLTNLTLVGLSIQNYANLDVTGCVFKYGSGSSLYPNEPTFGGAIYCADESSTLYVKDSLFMNNSAVYGGAIYMDGGILSVSDSVFIDNYANLYGGSIACEWGSSVTLLRTCILNSKSNSDAGGAIYLKYSDLVASSLNITNSFATFGSAITSLSSDVDISDSYFETNYACYNGGAIFHMYGDFTAESNKFIGNSARNGGALFVDNSKSVFLKRNDFIDNNATICAGAFYSLLNTFSSTSPYSDNTFINNHAQEYDNVFETDSFNIIIGNGNYTMYKVNLSNIDEIPSKYSLVDEGYVTTPKNQKVSGNCWAFATIAVLESCILKAGGPSLDLSEENIKNLMARFSDYGWDRDTNNDGGNNQMLLGYLLSWLGPVFDDDDPYDDSSTLSPILNSTIHIQNVQFLYRDSYTDNDEIKGAILKYGAVLTAMDYDDMYFRGEGYYCWNDDGTNHQVCIVGWDDNYSASNFYNSPGHDGAWLVRNSWGPDWNGDGYFYVSYYDRSFAKPNTIGSAFTFILNDTIRFDRNYQYDISGYSSFFINRNSENIYFKNVFNATDDEYLAAVSTYFKKTTDWEVFVYVNGDLKSTLNGVSPAGYFTLNLDDMVMLNKGDTFEVVFRFMGINSEFYMISPKQLNNPYHRHGLSFVSYDGNYWYDLYDYYGNAIFLASIKAFTYKNEINTSVSLDVETSYSNVADITARVTDQFGNIIKKGNVTFNIEGIDYAVSINDGRAKITHAFTNDIGMITASFAKTGYVESRSSWQPIISVELHDSIEINQGTATIHVTASKPINETVILSFNGRNYTQNLTNGITSFTLVDLANGVYFFEIFIQENPFINASPIVDSFEILDLLNTTITLDVECEYVDNVNIAATVKDQYGNVVETGQVTFNIEGTDYVVNITGAEAFISHNFMSNYDIITATFTGVGYYNSSARYVLVIPKRQVTLSDRINVAGKNVVINILANETINGNLIINIGSSNYAGELIDGSCTLTLNDLANGNYSVKVSLKDNIYYEASPIFDSFEILTLLNTTIVADVPGEAKVDEIVTVEVSVDPGAASGNYSVFIDGVDVTDEYGELLIVDGKGSFIVPGLSAGNHTISVRYNGDANYLASEVATYNIEVTKVIVPVEDIKIDVPSDVKVGDDVVITITLPENATGNVTVLVDGDEVGTAELENRAAEVTVGELAAGNHTIAIVYSGDDKYSEANATASLEVLPLNSEMVIVLSQNNKVGDVAYVTVTLAENATGSVDVYVDNVKYITAELLNGTVTVPIEGLAFGNHTIGVKYNGDVNYNASEIKEYDITVNKVDVSYDIKIEGCVVVYGQDATVTFLLPRDAAGNVSVIVDGVEYNATLEEGFAVVHIPGLNANLYEDLPVKYSGDEKYAAYEGKVTVKVEPLFVDWFLDNDDIYINATDEVTLKIYDVTEGAEGSINVTVNGEEYGVYSLGEALAGISISGFDACGTCTVVFAFVENPNFDYAGSVDVLVIVNPIGAEMNVTVPTDVEVGSPVEITVELPAEATGNLTIIVDRKDVVSVPVMGGKVTVPVEGLTGGNHTVSVFYSGDDKYSPLRSEDSILTVHKLVPTVSVEVSSIKLGGVATIIVSVPADARGNVFVDIGIVKSCGEIKDGKAVITIPDLPEGFYTVNAVFDGDSRYGAANCTASFEVIKNHSYSIKVTMIDALKLTAVLTDDGGNSVANAVVFYNLGDGKTLNATTNDKGEFVCDVLSNCMLTMSYVKGNASWDVSITLKNIVPSQKSTQVIVPSTMKFTAVDYNAGERGSMFYFYLKDGDGNPLANKAIKIGIFDKIYTVKTDKNGRGGLQINIANANYYTYAISFLGDDDCKASFAVCSLQIVKKSVTITPAKTSYSFKASAKTKTVTVALKSTNSYIPKGKHVTLTIAGKTFKTTIGDKGQINFNIGSITKKGTYKVDIKFAGTNTYAASNSQTMTIKIA